MPEPVKRKKKRMERLLEAFDNVVISKQEDIGFYPGLFAQSSLPYKEPVDGSPVWTHTNGDVSLTIHPGSVQGENGKIENVGYPYGTMPRLIILYLVTQAKQNKSPDVELGDNITDFLRRIGKSTDTRSRQRLQDQARRLFSCQFQFSGRRNGVLVGKNTPLVTDYQLWVGSGQKDHYTPDLFQARVKLNEFFYQEFSGAFPVNIEQLKGLSQSPLAIDLYMWLVQRVYGLQKPVNISWSNLFNQFGQQMSNVKRFSQNIRKELSGIQIVWPDLKIDYFRGGMTIRPSSTPIRE